MPVSFWKSLIKNLNTTKKIKMGVSVHRILDLFQECRKSGQWAQCFMETRGAVVSATFSVRCENGINGNEIAAQKDYSILAQEKPGEKKGLAGEKRS